MRVRFLGVRGSVPAPGADFVRFGGNTSCVALTHDGEQDPDLVLDAGTGLRQLSQVLVAPTYRGTIALSHLHWDHVLGVPFFVKGDCAGAEVDVLLPAQLGLTGSDLFARVMSVPGFPIGPEGLQGTWRFHAIEPGARRADGFDLVACEVDHKGGRTFGYRVADGSGSLAYLPDHDASVHPWSAARWAAGVDVLVHDSQYLEGEAGTARAFGHSTIEDALRLADEAGVGRLVLFHHSPARTDDELDRIEESVRGRGDVVVAREGMVLQIGEGG